MKDNSASIGTVSNSCTVIPLNGARDELFNSTKESHFFALGVRN